MNHNNFALVLSYVRRSAAALTLAVATLGLPAWAALTSVSPTSTAINVATGGTYSFTVTGSPGETVSTQSRFCFDVGVPVPANGIIFPAAGGCTSSSVIPSNPVVAAGSVYSFSGFVTPSQAGIMAAEAAAVGQPAGNRFVYWRQGFGTSGFAIVRVNLIEPVVVASPPTLSPTSLNFGNVNVGSSSTGQVMTLTNPGPGPINLTGAVASAGFTFSSNCTGILNANASCQFTVVFAPTAAQMYNGQLTISTTGGTVSGNLSGTGVTVPTAPPSLTPAIVNFGNVQVGQTSFPQFVTLNTGTPMNGQPVTISHPPWTVATTTCPNVLTGNLVSCQVTMSCVPTAVGTLSAPVSVTVGTFTVSSTVNCTGIAAPPPVVNPTLSPASKDFGSITVGATSASAFFVLLNPGFSPLNVTITMPPGFTRLNPSNCATVPANNSCGIEVIFAPTAAQSYSGVMVVTAGATNLSSSLSGVGVALPPPPTAPPSLLPATANFGAVTVGAASAAQTFTLTNPGSSALTGLLITAPAGFSQSSNCGTVLAGSSSCQITVTFAPTAAQTYSGVLAVTAGATNLSSSVSGVGTAAPPPPPVATPSLLPVSASFGSVTVGTTSAPQVLTLSNPGGSALTGLTIVVPPGFTQISNCGTSLAASGTCQITVTLTPTAAQTYSGLLVVTAGATSLSSSVSGIGAAVTPPPQVVSPSLLPATGNFGAVTIGSTPVTQTFTLTNPGSSALTGLVISAPTGFSQSSTCGVVLAANASCQITVGFAPTAAQAYNGLLSVIAGTTNLSSSVSGVGVAAPIVGIASTLTDVSPKRVVGNASSDLTQVLSYTFSGNTSNVSPGDGLFCLDLIVGLPVGNTTTGNPCTSGSQFARHPTVSGAFQSTRVGNFIRSVRETIRVPSAVSRFARENGRSRYYFARQFSPNQYAVVAIELLGNVANQPIALTDMRMYFKQGGEQPIVFLKRGDNLPTVEAKLSFTGSGWLRGAWEVVQPGDMEPTETDLMTDASLPLAERGLQRRYMVVGTFQQYLPAIGQITLTPPDLSRFPVRADGAYRVLLRLFADPAIGAENDGRLASGAAAFALPTARYFVGSFASHGTTSGIASINVSLPSANHVFAATEPVSFRWQATRDAAVYLLEAVDAGGKLVAAAQVSASAVELNAGYSAPTPWRTQASLGAGAVRWRVTAFSRDGEAIARSDWRGVRF